MTIAIKRSKNPVRIGKMPSKIYSTTFITSYDDEEASQSLVVATEVPIYIFLILF